MFDINSKQRSGLSNVDLSRHRLGTLGTVRTEAQVRPHEGFAPDEIAPRDDRLTLTEGERTPVMAKPPAWSQRKDLPCALPVSELDREEQSAWWEPPAVTNLGHAHQQEQAEAMCAGCPVLEECLAAALEEERGLFFRSRYLVRGGRTPWSRWQLDQQAQSA